MIEVKLLQSSFIKVVGTDLQVGTHEQEVAKKSKIEEFMDLELHGVKLVIIT